MNVLGGRCHTVRATGWGMVQVMGQCGRHNKTGLEWQRQPRHPSHMNAMKFVIPLHSLYWSIHTKDESKRGTAFAFIFGVN